MLPVIKASMKKIWGNSEQNFRLLFERHNAVMLLIEADSGAIVDANEAAAKFYGYSREELCALNITDINKLQPDEVAAERQRAKTEERNYFIFPHQLADGGIRTVEVHSSPVDVRGQNLLFSIIHDITGRKNAEEELQRYRENLELMVDKRTTELKKTNEYLQLEIAERKRAEEEREKLIIELQESILKIRMLSGLLPICSSCKKIRNDQGYWEQIEIYIREHSEADFSHGICLECAQRLYPEFYKKK
jgi:PAS domain S-box-containing protein